MVFLIIRCQGDRMSLKNRIFSGVGSSFEWFDFTLYGFFAPIFSQVFFSNTQDPWVSLVAAYGVFAIGFLARPIGAVIFGYLGDKYGRILPLKITPLLITFCTAFIAVLPSYTSAGIFSVIFLILIRITQGILLGGEYAGNMVYLCEYSPRWKYLWGSLASCTGSLGIIFASAVSALAYSLCDHEFMYQYGWRIAFLISLPIGVLIFLIRRKMPESPEFVFISNTNPIMEVVKKHKMTVCFGLGLIYLHATSFYFVFMFLPVFLNQVRHLPEGAALINNTWFLIIHLLLIPVFGWGVNFIGGIKSCIFIASLFLLFSFPLYHFLNYGNGSTVIFCLIALSIMTAVNAAVIPGLITELTPPSVRFTILALVFNIGFGIFGGLTPIIGLLLSKNGHAILSPGLYLTGAALVTLIVATILSFKAGKGNEIRNIHIT